MYISAKEDMTVVDQAISKALGNEERLQIEIRQLSNDEEMRNKQFTHEHGLLYLPNPYIVPGGRFNEVLKDY